MWSNASRIIVCPTYFLWLSAQSNEFGFIGELCPNEEKHRRQNNARKKIFFILINLGWNIKITAFLVFQNKIYEKLLSIC